MACRAASRRLREEPALREQLIRLLREGSRHARFAAAFVLFQDGPTLRVLPALLDALDLDDGDLRWSAAHMLATLGRMRAEVYPVLLHAAQRGASARRRRMALYVLRELAPERAETLAAVLAGVEDPDPAVRRAALSSMAKLTDPDRACMERVLEAVAQDPDPRMRRIAAVLVPDLIPHHPDLEARAREALDVAARADDAALARAAALALRRLASTQA